jgi:hypothetical protein
MTVSGIFTILGATLISAALAAAFLCGRRSLACALCAAANLAFGVSNLASGSWPWAIASFAVAAWCGWDWWRRNRRRAPRLIGAKARALIAALVKAMRESLRPRPVLRPLPGGAR